MQTNNIEAIERRLWSSADNLRANSNYASNEYFLPVMGLIFLRHAYNRFLRVKAEIEATLPSRGGQVRALTPGDFAGRGAIYLREEAQFDYLVRLPDSADRSQAVVNAMELIEADYPTLKGELPKSEYQKLDNDVMGQLLRTFNDPELRQASGDVFGRIYEYFLTRFAGLKAHDDGEFFTPVSIVQMIVNVIEPDHGKVLDPACGSGGMFVQSAHFMEQRHQDPTERTTFYGLEKNETTIRLAKMNLAVHGLEGNIQKAITYYEDPHHLIGKADFVMANPPFNVDEVDAEKVKNDRRLPFGLPGISSSKDRKGKVSNANYLWISYFHSYLNERGRAGFVMSSQASSAGRDEARVRRQIVETGDVDVMMSIRGGFFYTRTVPCELWFFDRTKPAARRDQVLMIDAREVHRKVTKTVYDFTPEQLANLTSIVWLYRGESERFLALLEDHLSHTIEEAQKTADLIANFLRRLDVLLDLVQPFLREQSPDAAHAETLADLQRTGSALRKDAAGYQDDITISSQQWNARSSDTDGLRAVAQTFAPVAEESRNLIKQTDLIFRLAERMIDICQKELNGTDSSSFNRTEINRARKVLDEARVLSGDQLKKVRYYFRHAAWLQERFPDAELRDVPGLVRLVDRETIAAHDWSLSPGRYVGVAPPEMDEDFDFEEALREIHVELVDLNDEAGQLAASISNNFESLGI